MNEQGLPEGTVTVLFTDVEGSTDLTTRRGDEAAREIFRAHFELVRQQVEQNSGQEVKTIGDSCMVAFSSARRAGAGAGGTRRALDERKRAGGAGLPPPEGAASSAPTEAIRVRIG